VELDDADDDVAPELVLDEVFGDGFEAVVGPAVLLEGAADVAGGMPSARPRGKSGSGR
jgi:hypothetical protein